MSLATTLASGPRRAGLFTASVALNLFLVMLLAAHLLRPTLAPAAPPHGEGPIGRIIDGLPASDAGRMRAVLDRALPERTAARDRVSAAQREVAAAIARTPYDEAAIRRALLAWQASWQDFSTVFNTELIEAIRTLSDEGRARFAAAALAEDARRRHE